jgi:two-component system sensor histidine kinase KdpD
MVCMSASVLAPRVIRAGARVAKWLGSQLYAVYVETPAEASAGLRRHDREALEKNIALAEQLGAIVVRVRAQRPSDGLIAFARQEGVTHVVFGQTARSRWELLWYGSTLEHFLGAISDATVEVVPLSRY